MTLSRRNTRSSARVTARGVAEIAGVSVYRVQELFRQRRNAERMTESGSPAQRAAARRYLRHDALPAPLEAYRPRQWSERTVRAWAVRTGRVVDGVPVRLSPPGRPAGGPPPMRRARADLADQLAAYDHVIVPAELHDALRLILDRTYARFRARGEDTQQARESAAEVAAQALGCEVEQARKVVLMVAVGRKRPHLGQLAHVEVRPVQRAALLPVLQDAVARWRVAGATTGEARAGAVEDVAAATGIAADVVWKVLLEAVYALT